MDTNSMQIDIGKTTISPEVIHKIATLTTLSVEGVSRMASLYGSLQNVIGKDDYQGAKVNIKESAVFVEIYVILMSNMNVRDISREIQARVSRAITEMIGMQVGGVNVHIMDIDFNT